MPPLLSLSQSLYVVTDKLYPRKSVSEGGLLTGADPSAVNESDPLRLWIIQLAIIMCTAQLLSLLLRKLKQPRVIAEIIGGIVLGPTVMGRVPGFTEHIFPKDSLPFLSLVANIGLVLFLFLVGLEIEVDSIKRNAKTSFIISMGAMILPFGIGAGMSKTIYNNFVLPVNPETKFTHFMLFSCVAYSITAFPILCRILIELKLLDTAVGICTLSAGVGNDIIGWTLLALSTALVNASTDLTALYIILIAMGWAVLVCIPFKKAFYYLALKTDSLSHSEPSLLFMTCTLIFVFGSAFFTDVIGVHAIFGGFLAGLVVPRENGLAIKMTEKIEDLVGILLLPLYFTLSGLSTNLGLLNTGRIWGFAIAIIVTAWFGKFGGASIGARVCGFNWREAGAIGELMSCKGLVELIVLNIGLQAGILSTLVFSMFVLEALVLTFLSTPGVILLYPPHLRRQVSIHPTGTSATLDGGGTSVTLDGSDTDEKGKKPSLVATQDTLAVNSKEEKDKGRWSNVTVILDRLEHLPGLICISELLRRSNDLERTVLESQLSIEGSSSEKNGNNRPVSINTLLANSNMEASLNQTTTRMEALSRLTTGKESLSEYPNERSIKRAAESRGMVIRAFRLLELSDRASAVMKSVLDSSSLLLTDPLVNIFKTIHELRGGFVRNTIKVEPVGEWANVIEETLSKSRERRNGPEGAELVITCWLGAGVTCVPSGNDNEQREASPGVNPLDFLFNKSSGTPAPTNSKSTNAIQQIIPSMRETTTHAHFVRSLFVKSLADVALFVDNASQGESSLSRVACPAGVGGHNTILLPFFGGPDDRAALDMVIQICKDTSVRGIIARVIKAERGSETADDEIGRPPVALTPGTVSGSFEDTIGNTDASDTVSQCSDTIYASNSSATRLQSQIADEMAWEKYSSDSSSHLAPKNVEFTHIHTPAPLKTLVTVARSVQARSNLTGRMLLVVGRSRRLAVESHHTELAGMIKETTNGHLSSVFRKSIGDVASALVVGGIGADILVLQAGRASATAADIDV